ncbi:MAG: hypothetical protein KDA60_13070 [Planctomycetales bacterium]|nr:hypothetical protein [Planctomycetales bacterium]
MKNVRHLRRPVGESLRAATVGLSHRTASWVARGAPFAPSWQTAAPARQTGQGATATVLGKTSSAGRIAIIAIALASVMSRAEATPIEVAPGRSLEVEYETGTGPDTSYFVVDFAENGGGTYAFSYHYDSASMVTGEDAWNDIVQSGGLEWQTTSFAFGLQVDGFSYQAETDSPNYAITQTAWSYFLGELPAAGGLVSWQYAPVGVSDRVLTPNSFDAWRVTGFDANFDPIGTPTAPWIATPEPGTGSVVWLVGLVLVGLLRRES